MRLYSLTNASGVDDPEYGHIAPEDDGGFDFPDDLSDRLIRVHLRGRKMWETEIERQQRLNLAEQQRLRDPATLYDAMERLIAATTAATAANAAAPSGQKATRRSPAKAPAAEGQ